MTSEIIAPVTPLRGLHYKSSPDARVQVFFADSASFDPRELAKFSEILSADEQKRAAQYYFARDRHHFMATRIYLRFLIGSLVNQPPNELKLESGPWGKPQLVRRDGNIPPLHFNLSHTGSQIVFALSRDCEVGVDLESTSADIDDAELNNLVGRVFSPRELGFWRSRSGESRAILLGAWVRKEAYLKATGEALFCEPNRIEVLERVENARPHWSRRIGRHLLYGLSVPRGLIGALAMKVQ